MPEMSGVKSETQPMNAHGWLLMQEGSFSVAAATYGIVADTSDNDLRAIATLAQRAASDQGIAVGGEDLLSVLKLVRHSAGRSFVRSSARSPQPDASLT